MIKSPPLRLHRPAPLWRRIAALFAAAFWALLGLVDIYVFVQDITLRQIKTPLRWSGSEIYLSDRPDLFVVFAIAWVGLGILSFALCYVNVALLMRKR